MHRGSRCDGDDLFDEGIRLTSVSVERQVWAARRGVDVTEAWEYCSWDHYRFLGMRFAWFVKG